MARRFNIAAVVAHAHDKEKTWQETWHSVEGATLQEAAQSIVDGFNRSLRPYETKRVLVSCEEAPAPVSDTRRRK